MAARWAGESALLKVKVAAQNDAQSPCLATFSLDSLRGELDNFP